MTLTTEEITARVEDSSAGRLLRVSASDAERLRVFEGEIVQAEDGWELRGSLSAANAAAVREVFPWLVPRPLGLHTSAGTGDRLGLATPGHVRAFRADGAGVTPVFAQQSIREMDRIGRDPQRVLDDATFGCLQAGWTRPVGADADHLKTTADIDRCLAAGFPSYTIDPGDHVAAVPAEVQESMLDRLDWQALEDRPHDLLARYSTLDLEVDERRLVLAPADVTRAALKYAGAVLWTAEMSRHLRDRAAFPVEVEVSVDETDEPTTLVEHVYLATELRRLGVEWVSFAPRYIGDFEKGVDYRGDVEAFTADLARHAQIARQLGLYKMSLHSGSDKFGIYERAVAVTDGLIHLKTSGTTYLVALGVIAETDPALFRTIYERSRAAYAGARASYQVSARLERAPRVADIADGDLARLLDLADSRQILHVGYGTVIGREAPGRGEAERELRATLARASDLFEERLESHIGRHLRPFSEGSRR